MKISIHLNDVDVEADKQTLVQLLALLTGTGVLPQVQVEPMLVQAEPVPQPAENVPAENVTEESELLPPEKETNVEPKGKTKKQKTSSNPFAPSDVLIANAYAKPLKDGQPIQILLIPYGRFAVKSWKDVLVETAEVLIRANLLPYQTIEFPNSQIPLVTPSKRSSRPLVRLTNGLYMDAGHSAKDIVRRAVALVEACGLSDKAFAVYYQK